MSNLFLYLAEWKKKISWQEPSSFCGQVVRMRLLFSFTHFCYQWDRGKRFANFLLFSFGFADWAPNRTFFAHEKGKKGFVDSHGESWGRMLVCFRLPVVDFSLTLLNVQCRWPAWIAYRYRSASSMHAAQFIFHTTMDCKPWASGALKIICARSRPNNWFLPPKWRRKGKKFSDDVIWEWNVPQSRMVRRSVLARSLICPTSLNGTTGIEFEMRMGFCMHNKWIMVYSRFIPINLPQQFLLKFQPSDVHVNVVFNKLLVARDVMPCHGLIGGTINFRAPEFLC